MSTPNTWIFVAVLFSLNAVVNVLALNPAGVVNAITSAWFALVIRWYHKRLHERGLTKP